MSRRRQKMRPLGFARGDGKLLVVPTGAKRSGGTCPFAGRRRGPSTSLRSARGDGKWTSLVPTLCHPERSEGSSAKSNGVLCSGRKVLRCAQDDSQVGSDE